MAGHEDLVGYSGRGSMSLPRLDRRKPTILFTHFPLAPTCPCVLSTRTTFSRGCWNSTWEPSFAAISTAIPSEILKCLDNDRPLLRTRPWQPRWQQGKGWFVCRAAASGDVTREFIAFQPRPDIPSRALAVALQKLGILAPATRLVKLLQVGFRGEKNEETGRRRSSTFKRLSRAMMEESPAVSVPRSDGRVCISFLPDARAVECPG